MPNSNIDGWSVGIDLGTTYSCVGVWQHKQVEIISNDQGYRTTPSYVAFTDSERLVGEAAKSQVSMNPINTIFDAKRLIGREFADPAVQKDMKTWPFKIIKGPNNKPQIEVTDEQGHRTGAKTPALPTLKLLDFNTAEICEDDSCTLYGKEGTHMFSPPEAYMEEQWDGRKQDAFAVGITLCCCGGTVAGGLFRCVLLRRGFGGRVDFRFFSQMDEISRKGPRLKSTKGQFFCRD